MKTLISKASIALALLAAIPAVVSAHAFVDRADPKVGSEGPAPAQVHIWFTQQPEVAFSKIQVFDASGREVDKNDTHADASDRKELIVSTPALDISNLWRAAALPVGLSLMLLVALLLTVLGHPALALILFVALLGLLLLVFLIAHMSVFKQVKNSSLH